MQAFAVIANSPLHIDLSCVLEHVIAELTAFLRKVWINIVLCGHISDYSKEVINFGRFHFAFGS